MEKCGIVSTENKIMLTIELCWGTRKTDSLTTKSAGSFDGRHAKFDDYYNLLQFAGPEELPLMKDVVMGFQRSPVDEQLS